MKYNSIFLIFLFINCLAHVKPINVPNCTKITGVPGPEDFAVDPETGILYISSHNRRNPTDKGHLFTINLKEKTPILLGASLTYPSDFYPHGLSFIKTPEGKKLYVISHTTREKDPHTIEVFKIEKENIIHEKTISDDTFTSPNDLFVFPDGRILVSNDSSTTTRFFQFMNIGLRLHRAKMAYFDGKTWTTLPKGHLMGNGVHVKKENGKEILYLADTVGNTVFKYELITNGESPDIKLIKEIELDSGPDNFTENEKGDILVATHKSLMRFLRHASNKENISASQVFVIKPDGSFKEIYANDGEEISASSTALQYNNKLYIAQVFEPFILSCPVSE